MLSISHAQMFCEKFGMTSASQPRLAPTAFDAPGPCMGMSQSDWDECRQIAVVSNPSYIFCAHLEEEDETAQREEFSVQLATFLLQYKDKSNRKNVTVAFAVGDLVEIIKESSKRGWRALVLDPCWHGLVKVQCVDHDGWVRAYEPHHLRKMLSTNM